MIPILKAKIENGVIILGEKESNYLLSLKNGEYNVTIKKPTNERSNNQNRYLWGCLYQILSDELGYTCEEIHEVCKQQFLKDWLIIEKKDGNIKEIATVRSTTSLNTVEFENYTKNIRQWASAELSIFLPLPNESDY